jgi:hypothetical protein
VTDQLTIIKNLQFLLKQKDAEIELLRGRLEESYAKQTFKEWERNQRLIGELADALKAKDAKIERLNEICKIKDLQIDQLIQYEQKTLHPIIAELADALKAAATKYEMPDFDSTMALVQRAREAIK